MARVVPDGWETMEADGALQREFETLAALAAGLPDDYTVYHAVHWTNVERSHAIYGEIDFVIVNRAGHLMLIEQKCGFLLETEDGLAKNYVGKIKSVPAQMGRTADGLRTKLAKALGGQPLVIEHLLFCPDHHVRSPVTAGLSPHRIVDAGRRDALCEVIGQILPPGDENPLATRVDRFLRDIIQLEIDVSALIGQGRAAVTRVSGGLAHWARQIGVEPFRLRVTGTAGSGKTQLALAEFRSTIEQGRRPLYVCFNRPLADHFAAIAPEGGNICTFHMLCDQMLRHAGAVPNFTKPDPFGKLVADAAALAVPPAFVFDTIIVDEGQDFASDWRDLVLRHAAADARVLWLEDPLQNLYGHPPIALPGWVRLRATNNFRSPRPVVRLLQAIVPDGVQIEASAPVAGAAVEFFVYQDAAQLREHAKAAIKQCYAAGFRKSDVVLLSFRGRESSHLLGFNQLGPHLLRTFSGNYDAQGRPVYLDGDVLAETVHRFKGQSAPAVVLAEVDFEELGEREIRRLFVGATRATMKLVIVVSERAAGVLLQRL
ncbi:ATP-binding domain-containing protein [Cupriavidus sp. IK-TO18]|uniref:ATP-binding domain-containing protein n=1 Tax=Cupriavidus sp. IK-TO18 TaxID=2782182 RepID=UPI00189BF61F|nr:ATP-binding domain-containing protein [Cupriavidus sp. IK-TO18]MBF6992524.1 ATP-binding domain-containing protein [Cupriavidus sp. IK-TO18]